MKKLAIFLLLTVCFTSMAEERKAWTFSHLIEPGLPPRLIVVYPEFRKVLEQLHGLINEGEYDVVSRILQDEIRSFCINTRDRFELEKTWTLIHIDAAVDFFLRDERQQGLNKQYMAFYLLSRIIGTPRDAS